MKKIAIGALFLLAASMGFARESENGALGFGIVSETGDGIKFDPQFIKWGGYFDMGYQLAGPIYVGFEFYGAIKNSGELTYSTSNMYVESYLLGSDGFGGSTWVTFIRNSSTRTTYTFWDLDFSPRAYASLDLTENFQLLAFAGIQKNWLTYDLEIKNTGGSTVLDGDGNALTPGNTYKKTGIVVKESPWGVVVGLRASLMMFYLDYTRFLKMNSGNLNINNFSTDKLSLGVSLRW